MQRKFKVTIRTRTFLLAEGETQALGRWDQAYLRGLKPPFGTPEAAFGAAPWSPGDLGALRQRVSSLPAFSLCMGWHVQSASQVGCGEHLFSFCFNIQSVVDDTV